VFVYTFSGWIKAFPTQTKKAQEVTMCLLKEIIPQFRIPVSIGSNNGLTFATEVVQLTAKIKIKNNLKATHGLPPPEFRESKLYKQDSKTTIGKAMPGDQSTMGSITAHNLGQD
jgi:hypothetical protein